MDIGNLIEKLGIVKDIGDIKVSQEQLRGAMMILTERVQQSNLNMAQDIGVIKKDLYGNGDPGMKTDLDRLVQKAENERAMKMLLWGAVIVNVADAIMRHVH